MGQPVEVNAENPQKETLNPPISGMACAACSPRLEKGLNRMPGILSADVNLALETGRTKSLRDGIVINCYQNN